MGQKRTGDANHSVSAMMTGRLLPARTAVSEGEIVPPLHWTDVGCSKEGMFWALKTAAVEDREGNIWSPLLTVLPTAGLCFLLTLIWPCSLKFATCC